MALTVVVTNADGSTTTHENSDGVFGTLPDSAQRVQVLFNGIPVDLADLTLAFTPPGDPNASPNATSVTVTLSAPNDDQEVTLTGNIEALFAPAAGEPTPDPGTGTDGENNPSTYNEASITKQMRFGSGGGGAGLDASTPGDGPNDPADIFLPGEDGTALLTVGTGGTPSLGATAGDPVRAPEASGTGTRSLDDSVQGPSLVVPSLAVPSPATATIEIIAIDEPPLASPAVNEPPMANPDGDSVTELGTTGAANGAAAAALFARTALSGNSELLPEDFVLGPTAIPQGGFGPGKWGSLPFGTGATVTWSLMTSGLATDGGTTSVALSSFMPVGFEAEIVRAFEAWTAVSNITFVQVADSGLPFNAAGATGDIRIGGHAFDGPFGVLAHGFFPPANGFSAAGDIHFDIAEAWVVGTSGPGFDIFQVAAHEVGHAVGLDHESDVLALMNPFYTELFSGLRPDDVAGGQFIYGRNVPAGNVLANDSEGSGGPLTVSAISGGGAPDGAAAMGAFGSLLIAATGGYTYELDDSNTLVDALDFGESLIDVFTYSVSDGAASDSSTLSITINGANDAPDANPDGNAITELMVSDDLTDNFVTGDVLLNDSDVDIESLTVSAISGGGSPGGGASTGAFGSLLIAAAGGYTYELDDSNTAVDGLAFGESLIDTFTYTVTDGDAFDTAILTITINGANVAPVANPDANAITELMVSDDLTDNNVTGDVLANDTDLDNQALTVSAISDGAGPGTVGGETRGAFGSLTIAADGNYTYELDDANSAVDALDDGETLIESFTYTITDGVASDTATLSITINGANDPPVANPDRNSITELMVSDDLTDNNVTGDVLLNDSDVDIETLTVSAISGGGTPDGGPSTGAFGSLLIAADGGYTYELDDSNTAVDSLADGESLVDSFTYSVTDGDKSDTAILTITITGANDAPVANPDANSITELMVSDDLTDNNVTGDVLANDREGTGGPLTVSAISGGTGTVGGETTGAFGSLTIAADGNYTYELDDSNSAVDGLDDGETLIDSFTYTITDGLASDTATLSITINGANDAPVANPDRISITELMVSDDLTDNNVTGDALANDSDVDGEPLTVSAISGGGTPNGAASTGAFGSLLIAAGGSYTYELDDANSAVDGLDPGESLVDSFTYSVTDGDKSDTATLSITINGALEFDPVARADSNAITELMSNSSDGEDTAAPNSVTGDVLNNDSDAKGGPLTVSAISGGGTPDGAASTGAFGTLTIAAGGGYTYELDETNNAVDGLDDGETLIDVFTYTASDGAASDTAILSITVKGANDAPAAGPDSTSITELMVSDDSTANFVTGDALAGPGTVGGVTASAFGGLTIAADGNYTYELDDSNATVDALDVGETLIDSFTFSVTDGGSTTTETLSITINGANDPPVANPDSKAITELAVSDDATANFVTGDVLPNDSDVDIEPLTVSAVAGRGGSEGNAASGTVGGTTQGAFGSLILLANGSYTYELDDSNADVNALNPAETLVDSFTYSVTDGDKTDTAALSITINGVGESSPIANPDSNAITELMVSDDATDNNVEGRPPVDQSEVPLPGGDSVLANDSQGTGGALTVSAISGGGTPGGGASTGAFGSLTILGNGDYTYELNDSNTAVDGLDDGETLIDVFTYTASDGAASDSSTLSITINGANDAPVAGPDSTSITELMVSDDATPNFVTGDVLTNDSDVDIEPLTVSGISGGGSPRFGIPATGAFGSLTIAADGGYTYELDDSNTAVDSLGAGETLIDVFTYSVTDGDKGATSTLSITINGALENAILARGDANSLSLIGQGGSTAIGNVLANDSEAKGGPLTVSAISGGGTVGGVTIGNFGSLALTAGGGYTYQLDQSNTAVASLGEGQTLVDSFIYTAFDGAQTDTATLTITIDNPNVAPVANADRNSITELMVSDDATANLVTGNVLANDTDSQPLTVSAINGSGDPRSSPFVGAFGSLLIAPGGGYTYQLDDFNGAVDALGVGETLIEVFTYTASDGTASNSATLNITINGALELAPVARADSNAITELMSNGSEGEDTAGPSSVTGDVLANDSEAKGGPLTVTAISGGGTPNGAASTSAFGTLLIAAGGGYSYQLDEANSAVDALNDGETLIDVFTYTASDGAASVSATLSITVNGANDAPATGPEGTSITELMVSDDLTANFVTGDALAGPGTVGGLTGGTFGGLTIAAGGNYTYELDDSNATVDALDDGETLIDSFTFSVTDGGSTTTATLSITINGANDPPVANPDTNAITELAVSDDATPNFVTGDVLPNDSDVDVEPLTVSAIAGRGGSEGNAAPGTVGGTTQGAFGSLTILANGSYTYELDDSNSDVNALNPAETLVDVFTYSVGDGGKTDTAALSITINGVGESSPIANPDSNAITELMVSDDATANNVEGRPPVDQDESPPPEGDSVLANDSQGTGGPLSVSAISGGGTPGGGASTGAFGNLTILVNGNYTYELDDSNIAVDGLDDGETLIDVFTYTASDGAASDTAILNITINGANDAPVGINDVNSITELMVSDDATANFVTGDVLANDTDVDIEDLTVSGISGGGSPRAGIPATGAFGSLSIASDGGYTYELDDSNTAVDSLGAGETLIDVFTYSITDGDKGDSATLSITINGALDNSILARADTNSILEPTTGSSATGDVLANDSQGKDGALTVSALSGGTVDGATANAGAFGSLTIAAGGGYTYELDGFNIDVQALGVGETLIDAFTYTVSDNSATDTAALSITIGNEAPIANPDTNSITELMVANDLTDNFVTGDVLGNDDEGIGGALAVSAISGGGSPGTPGGGVEATGTFGTLSIVSSGGYIYELDDSNPVVDSLGLNETLIDTFTYSISDSTFETDTATLSITINGTTDSVPAPLVAAAPCVPDNPCAVAVEDPIQIEDVLSPADNMIDFGDSGGTGAPPSQPEDPSGEPPAQEVEIVSPPTDVTILDTGGAPAGGGAGTEELLINA